MLGENEAWDHLYFCVPDSEAAPSPSGCEWPYTDDGPLMPTIIGGKFSASIFNSFALALLHGLYAAALSDRRGESVVVVVHTRLAIIST